MATLPPTSAPRPGFFRTLWRATRQVFHETTGALFFVLAFSWSAGALRQWEHGSPHWLLATCIGVALIMVWFGWVSFRAARRVR